MFIKAKLSIENYDKVVYSGSLPPYLNSCDCYIVNTHAHGDVDILFPKGTNDWQVVTVPANLLHVESKEIELCKNKTKITEKP